MLLISMVHNFPGYYVTSEGEIWSTKRNSLRVLSTKGLKSGYPSVGIGRSSSTTMAVHRIMASTFLPNPENKSQVNHIDGNKTNNHLDNLEWCTPRENGKHAYKLGLSSVKKGEEHHCAKLSDEQVKHIREQVKLGTPQKVFVNRFNVSKSYISQICNNHKRSSMEI